MTKPKNLILLLLLFIVVGIAAVSTNVIINGSTPIASNPSDFNVYFSNVLVNGTQDLSLVKSETSLVFTGEFSAVGDKKEITYDVTNASKNYDADIDISCTPSTTYLTITNSFDTSTNLAATSTRTGVLSITLSKSYTGADLTQDISCTITANAVERTSQGTSSVATPVSPFYIGKEISIGEEKFNIISTTDDTVTMLAQYNIDPDQSIQTKAQYLVGFSDNNGWDYSWGPKEIDIQTWSPEIWGILVEYRSNINSYFDDITVNVNLITLTELGELGCTITEDYYYSSDLDCTESPYKKWLINGQYWWTRSASSTDDFTIWLLDNNGTIVDFGYENGAGVRPVITISKEALE